MKFVPVLLLSIICIATACTSSKDKLLQKIEQSETLYHADSAVTLSKPGSDALIALYKEFVEKFPDDQQSPEYLFRGGEIANANMKPKEAIELFGLLHEKYSTHPKAPLGLFLQGFIYETQLRDFENSRKKYQAFLDAYPNHNLAKDVKFSLDHLGIEDEELIKIFEKQLQQQGDTLPVN